MLAGAAVAAGNDAPLITGVVQGGLVGSAMTTPFAGSLAGAPILAGAYAIALADGMDFQKLSERLVPDIEGQSIIDWLKDFFSLDLTSDPDIMKKSDAAALLATNLQLREDLGIPTIKDEPPLTIKPIRPGAPQR
jgi:hypothetical protein